MSRQELRNRNPRFTAGFAPNGRTSVPAPRRAFDARPLALFVLLLILSAAGAAPLLGAL